MSTLYIALVTGDLFPFRLLSTLPLRALWRVGVMLLGSVVLLWTVSQLMSTERTHIERTLDYSPVVSPSLPAELLLPEAARKQMTQSFAEQLALIGARDVVALQAPQFVDLKALEKSGLLDLADNAVWLPELGVPVSKDFLEAFKKDQVLKARPANATEIKKTLELVRIELQKTMSQVKAKQLGRGVGPLRILLVTTWRSGSTFLGQLLANHPGVFQHYEPLSYLGVKQVHAHTDEADALRLLRLLSACKFSDKRYLDFVQKNLQDMSGHNVAIWEPCRKGPNKNSCGNETFLRDACLLFPIQLTKLVRLRLNATLPLLAEKNGNYKVIFLIRDPRAIMNSRYSSVRWCQSSDDCIRPEKLCGDMENDVEAMTLFHKLYPKSFTLIKYEDVALQPQETMKNLFDFLGLDYMKRTDEYIKNHTESNDNAPWSIRRRSSERVNRWKTALTPEQLQEINHSCYNVMNKLQYL